MICNHCVICTKENKCTKMRHVCAREFTEKEALKDIKPVRWKAEGRK